VGRSTELWTISSRRRNPGACRPKRLPLRCRRARVGRPANDTIPCSPPQAHYASRFRPSNVLDVEQKGSTSRGLTCLGIYRGWKDPALQCTTFSWSNSATGACRNQRASRMLEMRSASEQISRPHMGDIEIRHRRANEILDAPQSARTSIACEPKVARRKENRGIPREPPFAYGTSCLSDVEMSPTWLRPTPPRQVRSAFLARAGHLICRGLDQTRLIDPEREVFSDSPHCQTGRAS